MATIRLADDIASLGVEEKTVDVQVSYEVVKLFSEQLYASPVKAVEELVVNSWDAEAAVCSVLVDLDGERPLIAVFDTGQGMTLEQLENLWHIGISHKQKIASKRKQIGKFGIGKLASYAVARRATYISKTIQGIHAVSMDFDRFAEATDAAGLAKPVKLVLRSLANIGALNKSQAFTAASAVFTTQPKAQDLSKIPTWTLVVLEDLKEKAHRLATERLRWVLETAMPLESDFDLYLNGDKVSSAKQRFDKVVEFRVDELEEQRLTDLGAVTGETWSRIPNGVKCDSFPSGITGEVFVTRQSLYAAGGKSEDLGRSHGFFVRVHNRLINETDPLFGARPLSFSTFYRFAAVIEASDLNPFVTASRDDVEQTEMKAKLRELLIQLFNQARDQYDIEEKKAADKGQKDKEGYRDYVGTELVERPLADALVAEATGVPVADKKDGWRLVSPIDDLGELQALVQELYATERKDRRYSFKYSPAGPLGPIARLDARTGAFFVNEDHQLVREFATKPESKRLLEALIVAEALLEVYLRAAAIEPEIVSDLLERRDSLLRGLALDETYSLVALAKALRESSASATDLEIALVGALRALGFGARHIAGPRAPDGLANYLIHGLGEQSFTLEAKSSKDVPSLPQLDFAGLHSHFESMNAQGCLLVAPSYPAGDDLDSEVSRRAIQQGVSCWTIDQLARVVESAERRHVNARSLQDIVLNQFAPLHVSEAVERLMSEPTFDKVDLYIGIIAALASLESRLRGTPRNVSMIAAEISREPKFAAVDVPHIREAVVDLARASSGMLHISEKEEIQVLGALEELRRRVSNITGESAPPRRRGTFRANEGDASGGK